MSIMLIQEAKRFQQLAGIKEEQGYYLTPTEDPKTAQLHFTTDEKPSLSKNYEPLSPKSKRKVQLTPELIKKELIDALRDNKMDYEAAIISISGKYSLDKDKLKQDFPRVDILSMASLDEINQVVNEALKRFRMNEAEVNSDTEIDAAMKAGLAALTNEGKKLEEIEDNNQPQELNESVVALIASGMLAAPKIIEWVGKAIGFITNPFKKDNKDENTIAKKVEHFAHKWEKVYIKAIMWVVKKTKFVKQIWMDSNGKVDDQKLLVVAKYLYAAILAIALGNAVGTILGPASPIMKAIEGSLGGVKAIEIAQIASKVKGQL